MQAFNQIEFYFQDNNICTYKFTARQQLFEGNQVQKFAISAVVEAECYSGKSVNLILIMSLSHALGLSLSFYFAVGTFKGLQATEYCLTVTDMAISGSPFDSDGIK